MGRGLNVWGVSAAQIDAYYIFVIISFLYLVLKYKKSRFSLYIILLFYPGMMSYLSKDIMNAYRIGVVLLSSYWLVESKAVEPHKGPLFPIISFLLFSATFFCTSIINYDYFKIIISQYSSFFVLFVFYLIFVKYRNNNDFKLIVEKVLYDIILIQIFLTIVKFLIMGRTESIVGSISSQGGAMATCFPMLGFMYLWLHKEGDLEHNDLIIIIGLFFIGLVSNKRAIWFIMPILISAFMIFIQIKKIEIKDILVAFTVVPLIFYFGVRLNKTLNKEHDVWGRFDINYAVKYSNDYMFGYDRGYGISRQGRGGATKLLFEKAFNFELTNKDWVGYGLRFMYATNYQEFDRLNLNIKIDSKGSAAGVFQTMVSNGYLGVFAMIIFAISLIIQTRNKKLKYVLLCFFFWEYLFYTGIIFRTYALSFLFLYIVVLSDINIGPSHIPQRENNV